MSGTIVDTLITGLPLVPLVLGIYLVLRIREDFDLTVEGSFTIGGAVAAALLVHGQPVAVALALAILAGLLALGGMLFGLFRWRAWEPDWAHRMRHATGEAGWRAASTWAEFTDFVRFGR
jgi:ABC-type uncharacterized transport system permease subunit